MSSSSPLTHLRFGSCHKTKYARPDLWPLILQNHDNNTTNNNQSLPQVWVWTGDAIYPPVPGIASLTELQNEYQKMKDPLNTTIGYGPAVAQRQQQPLENTTTSATPLVILGSWDDHDYGGNDYGKAMPDKHDRARLFREFLGEPLSTLPHLRQRNGTYASILWGNPNETNINNNNKNELVHLLLLDTRWHRDDHCGISSLATWPLASSLLPSSLSAGLACVTRWMAAGLFAGWCRNRKATILGAEQWTWLEQQVQHSPASLMVVVSSIQVWTTNPVVESWGQYPSERQRLLELLASCQSRVVVVSGDVHAAEILGPRHGASSQQSNEPQEPQLPRIVEVTSSGLTHTCRKAGWYGWFLCDGLLSWFHQHRFGSQYFAGRNFGQLLVNWTSRQVEVSIHDARSGKAVLSTGHLSLDVEEDDTSTAAKWTAADCMDGHLIRPVLTVVVLLGTTIVVWWRRRRGGDP